MLIPQEPCDFFRAIKKKLVQESDRREKEIEREGGGQSTLTGTLLSECPREDRRE